MKLKKILTSLLVIAIFIAQITIIQLGGVSYAQENRTIETTITKVGEKDLNNLKPGEEFEVIARIGNFTNISKGLVALSGQLEYDSNILTRMEISGQNGWVLGDYINESSLKFIMDNGKVVTGPSDVLKMKFKVKNTITSDVSTTIKIKNIKASGGEGVVSSNDAQIDASVKIPVVPDGITSEKYVVREDTISRIAPGTTFAKFKENVVATPNVIIINKQGNTLSDTDIISTGMTIKVGDHLQYTAIVTGDIDGREGTITANDLAQIKLHLIEKTPLSGIAIEAADIDNDGAITINDVAQIRLVLLDLMTIE